MEMAYLYRVDAIVIRQSSIIVIRAVFAILHLLTIAAGVGYAINSPDDQASFLSVAGSAG